MKVGDRVHLVFACCPMGSRFIGTPCEIVKVGVVAQGEDNHSACPSCGHKSPDGAQIVEIDPGEQSDMGIGCVPVSWVKKIEPPEQPAKVLDIRQPVMES